MSFPKYQSNADLTSVMIPSMVVDKVLADSWERARYVSDADESSATEGSAKIRWQDVLAFFAVIAVFFWAFKEYSRKTKAASSPSTDQGAAKPDRLVPIRSAISRIGDATIQVRAIEMLDRLSVAIRGDWTADIPSPAAVVADDGALLLEWTKGRRRMGINIEKQPTESGWYFVSLEPDRLSSASGTMADLDLPALLRRLLD
jgi:hypothetical protein